MQKKTVRKLNVRKMTFTAMMGVLGGILMLISFSIPIMPSFIKVDFSELPALIAAFSAGPVSGVVVCLLKNLINILFTGTSTGGVGELCNFLLGVSLVLPSALLYKKIGGIRGAVIGALIGSVIMGVCSLPINYFITYPFYTAFMPMSAILQAYRVINPNVETLFEALLWFNAPFTFCKGLISALVTLPVYRRLRPMLGVPAPAKAL